jgi:predicted TIM-barrel fold metal-dependent hydrolase
MKNQLLIDVHSHIMPDFYKEALAKCGITNIDGFPTPKWSAESHLKIMDENGISVCMLSLSSPGLSPFYGEDKKVLAGEVNDLLKELKEQYPSRFGAFATLSLPDVTTAVEEIAYTLDVLKLDGVALFSNYDGIYLGDEKFKPMFEALDKRNAVIFVHPTAPPAVHLVDMGIPAPMIEYPFESTRMVASLLVSDTIGIFPNVKIIVPHGGGTVPYLAPRIAKLVGFPNKQFGPEHEKKIMQQLSTLYYDLTAATHKAALAGLQYLVSSNQILMGFDFPFMPPQSIPAALRDVNAYELFSNGDQELIKSVNALKLFPNFNY